MGRHSHASRRSAKEADWTSVWSEPEFHVSAPTVPLTGELHFLFGIARRYLQEQAAKRDANAELAFLRSVATGERPWSNAQIRRHPEQLVLGLLRACGTAELPSSEDVATRIETSIQDAPASNDAAELAALMEKLSKRNSPLTANACGRISKRLQAALEEARRALEVDDSITAEVEDADAKAQEEEKNGAMAGGMEDSSAESPSDMDDAASEVPSPLKRTEAQVEAMVKVNEVTEKLDQHAHDLQQLKRAASSIYHKAPTAPAREALARVKSLQQRLRNFRVDCEEELVHLDNITSLHAEDRAVRKENIRAIEALLNDLETAAANLQSASAEVTRRVDAEDKHAEEQRAAEERARARQRAEEQEKFEEERAVKKAREDTVRSEVTRAVLERGMPSAQQWASLSLDARAAARSSPHAYLITVPVDADPESVRIDTNRQRSTLTVKGVVRPRSKLEWLELRKAVARWLSQLPLGQLEQLHGRETAPWLALGEGRYGTFSEDVQLPEDAVLGETSGKLTDEGVAVTVPRAASFPGFAGFPRRSYGAPQMWW